MAPLHLLLFMLSIEGSHSAAQTQGTVEILESVSSVSSFELEPEDALERSPQADVLESPRETAPDLVTNSLPSAFMVNFVVVSVSRTTPSEITGGEDEGHTAVVAQFN